MRSGALQEGIELLPKPFSPKVLSRRVRQILDREG
jgi:DNA-binding response OmpR family regulator